MTKKAIEHPFALIKVLRSWRKGTVKEKLLKENS